MANLDLIALDGPSGSGKSTTAKALALALGWDYLDTGAMYRSVALALSRQGLDACESQELADLMAALVLEQRGGRNFLGNEDVSDAIRTPEMSRLASQASALPMVRRHLVAQQQRIGQRGHWVVDGRDIGTRVFPEAVCKIFLVASVEVRAQRRWAELQGKGVLADLEEVRRDIQERDHQDMTRALDPLRRAPDAVDVETDHRSVEEVVQAILKIYKDRKG